MDNKTILIILSGSGISLVILSILLIIILDKQRKINHLKELITRLPVPIFFKDKDRKFTECNKAFETLLWVEKGKLMGKTVYDMFDKEIADFLDEKELDLINHGGEKNFEFIFSHLDGTEHKVLCHLALESGLKGSGVIGTFIDITQRYLMKKKLKSLNEDYSLILDNGPIQIWYFSGIDTYGKINHSHARFLGITKESANNSNIYDIMDKDDAEELSKKIKYVFSEKKKINEEIYLRNSQGEERLLYTIITPMFDENNNVKNVVCTAIDITESQKT